MIIMENKDKITEEITRGESEVSTKEVNHAEMYDDLKLKYKSKEEDYERLAEEYKKIVDAFNKLLSMEAQRYASDLTKKLLNESTEESK